MLALYKNNKLIDYVLKMSTTFAFPRVFFCSSFVQIEEKQILSDFIEIYNKDQWPFESLSKFIADCSIQPDFVSQEEETQLLQEIEPHMKRMRWEEEHWDQQIHLYREREQLKWNTNNQKIVERIWRNSFPNSSKRSPYVHILDLHEHGFIRPHLDESRYCGGIISGLSLLSSSIMRLVHTNPQLSNICKADLLLPRRSLYRLTGVARFDFTHEILANEESNFRGKSVPRHRRISVICREFPKAQNDVTTLKPENKMKIIPQSE
ncbi:hypothetical protein ACQ4LE_005483 [Meloidogyne hapla]|uniref:2OG-FeII_Oxy_2 domain-containing protein n=1 Tax=Meloidogyne hapla TaxID=6305 RepID=A0A1I8B5U6_MELHA